MLMNTVISRIIPSDQKNAWITIIPKTSIKSKNPSDYRPISLTSCLGKLALIKSRLYKFLEGKGILVDQQSGFSNYKDTSDNLLFFTQ